MSDEQKEEIIEEDIEDDMDDQNTAMKVTVEEDLSQIRKSLVNEKMAQPSIPRRYNNPDTQYELSMQNHMSQRELSPAVHDNSLSMNLLDNSR